MKSCVAAASLHDIGKISTPDVILNKPAKLTPQEYAIVKQHPMQGVRIVEPLAASLGVAVDPLASRANGWTGISGWVARRKDPARGSRLGRRGCLRRAREARPYRPAMKTDACLATMREDAANGGLDAELVALFERLGGGGCAR